MEDSKQDSKTSLNIDVIRSNAMDESSFLALFDETLKSETEAANSIRNFWNLFIESRESITLADFHESAREVHTQIRQTSKAYESLLINYPSNPQLQTSFANFQRLIMRDVIYNSPQSILSTSDQSLNHSMAGDNNEKAAPLEVELRFKLQQITDSDNENPSIIRLSKVLIWLTVSLVIYPIIGIIVSTFLPNPILSYQLMDSVMVANAALSQVLAASIIYYINNNNDAVKSYCAWNTTFVTPQMPLCPWIKSGLDARNGLNTIDSLQDLYAVVPAENRAIHPVRNMLPIFTNQLKNAISNLKAEYEKTKSPGASVDNYISQSSFELAQFGVRDKSNTFSIPAVKIQGLWNALDGLLYAAQNVTQNRDSYSAARNHLGFLIANRKKVDSIMLDLMFTILSNATARIGASVSFNFALFGVVIFVYLIVLGVVITPAMRRVHQDRFGIPRLYTTLSRDFIQYFVSHTYPGSEVRDNSNERTYLNQGVSEGPVALEPEKIIRYYFWILFSVIVFVVPILIYSFMSLVRAGETYAIRDTVSGLALVSHYVGGMSSTMFSKAYDCLDAVCGDVTAESQFFSAKFLTELLLLILPDITKHNSIPYEDMNRTICSSDVNGFMERCVQSNSSVYFPPYFANRTSRGYGALMSNLLSSIEASVSSSESRLSSQKANDFWFVYETLFVEAKRASLDVYANTSSLLRDRLRQSVLAGQLFYGLSLGIALMAFVLILRPLHQTFVREIRWQRAVLFLVPQRVLRECEPFGTYIRTTHHHLFQGP